MSRFKPSDEDFEKRFNWQFFTENNIKLLVTIGGDDTASTANRVAKISGRKASSDRQHTCPENHRQRPSAARLRADLRLRIG